MVTIQGLRRSAAPTSLTPSALAFTLIVFLGLFLALAESSPSGVRSVDGGQVKPVQGNAEGHELREVLYGGYPIAKRMAKFIVHRRGVPLIIHKRIPYIVHKRMDIGGNGFEGDTFSSGFGDFSTTRRKKMGLGGEFGDGDTFSQGFGDFSTAKRMDTNFHGDTFSSGFGDFSTV